MKGIIVSIASRQSKVLVDGKYFICEARGNIKKTFNPLVGDVVDIEIIDELTKHALITNIYPRKNELYRPKIANLDQVLIVTSVKEPELATYILNKYIWMLEIMKIKPVLIFTKLDLITSDDQYIIDKISSYKKMGYEVFCIDNKKPDQIILDNLHQQLQNKVNVFTGQSGAGKSSTLNNFLNFEKQIKTQEISMSLNRGKHTTTDIQLYPINGNILIADTPGFSSFELKSIEISDLLYNLKIFKNYINKCQFNDCKHLNEKKCQVKIAVEQKLIPHFIYNDYKKLVKELATSKRG
ncbi:ribosome biogenesis GTPase [Williamsoniiplasma somnilux]|uniref:Small ribosomal subunit biogenesis GTPase RsgA n=1 Tax=Williamsoniiplasma somnilux TaxID=215578 RepID=A0A2K8NXQ3_9MOLU|nr:ribosome small subunit-dependent GTPase A [Williamsoniiplasma somnilux]ATZ18600.1 ribosome biogenesis GTPase [Williamsoniiplasma somnilux]